MAAVEQWHSRWGGAPKGKYLNSLLQGAGANDELNRSKILTLYSIANVSADTTILFDGHGSPENWAFSENQAEQLDRSLSPKGSTINYQELSDALIESGNIGKVNLIGSTCYSYDYFINLFSYLESKGIKEKPRVSITAANKERSGWGGGLEIDSRLLEALYLESEKGKPINVGHFYRAEGRVWQHEDPALFVGGQGGDFKMSYGAVTGPSPTGGSDSSADGQGEVNALPTKPRTEKPPMPEPEYFDEISSAHPIRGKKSLSA